MIIPILMLFIIYEVIAIFYYKSKGEEEKADQATNSTIWFVVALVALAAVSIVSAMLTQSTGVEQGYAY